MNTSDEVAAGSLKLIPVPAIEDFIGNAQQTCGHFVLKIEEVPSCQSSHRLPVLFVVLHDLLIACDSLNFGFGEEFSGDVFEFVRKVLPNVPWISRERELSVRGGDQCGTSGPKYAVDFLKEQDIVANVLDHLKAHNHIVGVILQTLQRRNVHAEKTSGGMLFPQTIDHGLDLVYRREGPRLCHKQVNAPALATSDLEHVTLYKILRHNICLEQSLMNRIVRSNLLAGDFGSEYSGHDHKNSIRPSGAKNNSKIKLLCGYCGSEPGSLYLWLQPLVGVNVFCMKKYLAILFLLFAVPALAQPLRDINYAYLYSPEEAFAFNLRPVRGEGSFTIIYSLEVKDTANLLSEYTLEWEGRSMLSDKEGSALLLSDHITAVTASGLHGRATISAAAAPRYVVVKVIRTSARRAWLFHTTLRADFPVNNFLMRGDAPVLDSWVRTTEQVTLGDGDGAWTVSWYDDDFPAAAPAFSEAQARVSRGMAVDSVFLVRKGERILPSMKGLYLIQKDTNAVQGLAFRAEDDYPQYSRVANLAGPLIYITTKQEYDRLEASKGNKRVFDRIVLGITADTERARRLMRNYFRRVELANRYFTSYKEGWKTDRGMVYIVFGPPEEVYKFDDREVWSYKNSRFNARFTFARSTSLFDPDNFVLIREKKFEETWYLVVDLWRNARF